MSVIQRGAYADMFGPTVGDRVRLGDTELWIEVEEDKTIYMWYKGVGGIFSSTHNDYSNIEPKYTKSPKQPITSNY